MSAPNYERIALELAQALEECRTQDGALCLNPKRPEVARRRIRYIDAVAVAALAKMRRDELSVSAVSDSSGPPE